MPADATVTEVDIAYEEELLRDQFQIKTWIRYIASKREAAPAIRYQLYERALKIMPGRCAVTWPIALSCMEGQSSRARRGIVIQKNAIYYQMKQNDFFFLFFLSVFIYFNSFI